MIVEMNTPNRIDTYTEVKIYFLSGKESHFKGDEITVEYLSENLIKITNPRDLKIVTFLVNTQTVEIMSLSKEK